MRLQTCLCIAAVLAASVPAFAQAPRYDVSYLWRADRAGVVAYRKKVAGVLGPGVASRLKVVRSSEGFGLVYVRRGALKSAAVTARVHTRLLAAKGLPAAAPILAQKWQPAIPAPRAPVAARVAAHVVAPAAAAHVAIAAPAPAAAAPAAAAHVAVAAAPAAPAVAAHVAAPAAPAVAAISNSQSPEAPPMAPAPSTSAAPAKPSVSAPAVISSPAPVAAVAPAAPVAAAAPAAPVAAASPADPEPALQLQDAIAAFVKKMRNRGLVQRDERTAWSVYDISRDVELAGINQDVPLQTASLIKPFIALAFFDEVAAGKKSYTPQAQRHMRLMIQDSDNRSADWFLRLLGGPAAVQRRLKKNHGSILRDMSLVEYIPVSGKTYRNKASVHDYTRFLHALWADALPFSAEIKRVMQLPKRNRLLDGAKEVPGDTLVYDKTGSTSRLCGDMGILVARGKDGRSYPYILVGVIQKRGAARHYMSWIHRRGDVIREVSNMAYRAIAARYGLDGNYSASAR